MTELDAIYEIKGFEFDPNVTHFFCGNVYAKRMSLPKGAVVSMHVHKYDHLSIVAKGRVRVLTDEGEQEYGAGDCLQVKAGVRHGIVGLEDSIWFCINSDVEPEEVRVNQ